MRQQNNVEKMVAKVRSAGNQAVSSAGGRGVAPTQAMMMNEAQAMGDVLCMAYPKLPATVYLPDNRKKRRAYKIHGSSVSVEHRPRGPGCKQFEWASYS